MDLYAYVQIGDLEPLLEANGIKEIKRLRGLRLMKFEKPLDNEKIKKIIYDERKSDLEYFFAYDPKYQCWLFDERANLNFDWYIKGNGEPRWNRIHGKLRKAIKFEIKKSKRRVIKQYEMWNKYCGREDVLYIHTRTGGNNWNYYSCNDYFKEPWFLDKVDDSFDSTYCDIYAKIDTKSLKILEKEAREYNDQKQDKIETEKS